ncbi:hypothetical protein [Carnobacterium divergens]|uniref:hypothetical protein n=1 Tax=Carnobacterium divergens TaxID=2748 RepID=UPI001930EC5E|nr:hypothetical protein [Carnobacterium divergens]
MIEEIFLGNGFAIIKNNDEYKIEWPQGPFDQAVSYPITKELVEKANDTYEVMIYAETARWPSRNTEDEEKKLENIYI